MNPSDSGLNLKITHTAHTNLPELPSLNLEDLVLKGKAGQGYWTVGSDPRCDIIIPTVPISYLHQFAVMAQNGKYFVKDLSSVTRAFETTLRPNGEEEYPIKEGDIINLGFTAAYRLTAITTLKCRIELVEDLSPEEGKPKPTEGEIEMDDELEEGVFYPIGRGKDADIQIEIETISRKHCEVAPWGLKDTSGAGTFIHIRTPE